MFIFFNNESFKFDYCSVNHNFGPKPPAPLIPTSSCLFQQASSASLYPYSLMLFKTVLLFPYFDLSLAKAYMLYMDFYLKIPSTNPPLSPSSAENRLAYKVISLKSFGCSFLFMIADIPGGRGSPISISLQ